MKLSSSILACVSFCCLAACAELIGPQYALRPSALLLDEPGGPVHVSDTVAVSTTTDILVWTSGGGCNKIGTTDVKVVDDFTVEIRPYDYAQTNPSTCNLIEFHFQHRALVQFSRTGVATVRVIGQNPETVGTITKTVVVR